LRDDLTARAAIIVVAVGKPDFTRHRLLDFGVVAVLHITPDLDCLHFAAAGRVQYPADESGLNLVVQQNRVDAVGVRTIDRA
jgi:hypothetical protein